MKVKEICPMPMPHHLGLAAAAVLVSLGSFALLLSGFDAASPRQWLLPNAEVMAQTLHCDSAKDRALRDACVRRVVAALLKPQPDEAQFASR